MELIHWKTACAAFIAMSGCMPFHVHASEKDVIKDLGLEKNYSDDKSVVNVRGLVVDASGEPLIGASVTVKGTSEGVITDLDGRFQLDVLRGSTILVSYMGYKSQELVVSKSDVKIVLKEDVAELNEVVVTALGIKRSEKALSYNVQQVKGDDLLLNKSANFINSLSGKVAGVNINSGSSGNGSASKVVIRGTRSIEQSSNVLYVVDGIPMINMAGEGATEFGSGGTTEAIADINPEDIESMSVLSGAAAAALYGNKASNGAILITTKKGSVGKVQVTVSQNTEFSAPFVLPSFQNRYGTGSMLRTSGADSFSWGRLLNSANSYNYDPRKDYFQRGVSATESVSISSGSEHNQTYFSASVLNSKGIIPNNRYNRYNFTFRNTTSMLEDRLKLDVGLSYVIQDDINMINQGTYGNPLVSAYLFPRGNDFEEIKAYEYYDSQRMIYTQNWNNLLSELSAQNPYWTTYRMPRSNKKHRYMMNAGITYDICDWLNLSSRVRIDNSVNVFEAKYYASTDKLLTGGSENGFYEITNTDDKQVYADILLNLNKRLFDNRLSVAANIGASISDIRQKVFDNNGPIRDDLLPNIFNVYQLDPDRTKRIQTGYTDQTQSVFGSFELGWDSKYYLTLTGRNDWPSMLAGPKSNKSSFFYPSVGLSWILSETFRLPDFINYLKLNGSFASVGIPFPRWFANPVYEWDENSKQWKTQSVYPMYNLKPERTDSWEIGMSARFLNHFKLNLTLYSTNTYNQTFNPQISVSSGYSEMYIQTGSVLNKGIEFSLGYDNKWGDLSWSSNYTFSANKNKINELVRNYVHPETGAIINKDRLAVGGVGSAQFILKEGGSLGDIYSTSDLQRDSEGKVYIDLEGKVYRNSSAGDFKLGSVFPKANMAWRNDFSWKNFNFGFLISARIGGVVYSATQAALDYYGVSEQTAAARDRGYVLVNGADYVNPEAWYSVISAGGGIPQFYTYSATNVRLQEMNVGYTFDKELLWGLGELSLSLTGRNLFMFYCKAPFDPEITASTGNFYQGLDNYILPSMRNFGFNVKLKF